MSRPHSGKLHAGLGFRIRTDIARVPMVLMERFREFDVPDISDVLNGLYAVDFSITRQTMEEETLCGAACTVRVFPGDNLMVHKALDVAQPGDVIVVDAGGDRSANAVLGDRICAKAKVRKIAGFVIDGLVRDLPGIDQLGVPVFARATTTMGPSLRGPGEINYPVCCGGKVVHPGDVIVADSSGIVVIPNENAEEVLERAATRHAAEKEYLASLQAGEFSNDWVDDVLKLGGCLVDDRSLEEQEEDASKRTA